MKKRKYLFLGCMFLFFVGASKSYSQQPNVLLIVADDMGLQCSALNTHGVQTPTIDYLIKHGTLTTKAYATFSSCSPSRTSFLTGTFPHVNGVTTNVNELLEKEKDGKLGDNLSELNKQFAVNQNVTSLIEVLNRSGYYTGLTGKFHVSSPEKFPFDYWGKDVNASAFFKEAKKSGKPFFLDYNLHTPHRPYAKSPNDRSKIQLNSLEVPAYLPNNALMQQDWSDYLGSVEATDRAVADVMKLLADEGLEKNTLVIFIADHGPSIHRGKYSEYEFGSHVPIIFSGLNIPQGKINNSLFSLADLMPTILDLLHLEVPTSVNGASKKLNLLGDKQNLGKFIYTEVSLPRKGEPNFQGRGMSDGRYWYIRRNGKPRMPRYPADNFEAKVWGNFSYQATLNGKDDFPEQYRLLQISENPPIEELFDLNNDPWSIKDLAKNADYKKILKQMRKQMDQWIINTNDHEMMITIKK